MSTNGMSRACAFEESGMCPFMTPMRHLELCSEDARFRVRIPAATVSRLLYLCRVAGRLETGGILVGRYSDALDCALVSAASGPPPDSKRGPTWFQRGTRGLQAWLERRWASRGDHYLGEWHFHPHAEPTPSATDLRQLDAIALSTQYRCPEPLLLIVGGDPRDAWSLSGHVVPRSGLPIQLQRESICNFQNHSRFKR
ncbi:Mov34/MPN/PAD-1 family protein [Myxococcus xanthus]